MKNDEEFATTDANPDELKAIEQLMGPAPDDPQAAADLLKRAKESKEGTGGVAQFLKGHGFRKKQTKQPKPKKSPEPAAEQQASEPDDSKADTSEESVEVVVKTPFATVKKSISVTDIEPESVGEVAKQSGSKIAITSVDEPAADTPAEPISIKTESSGLESDTNDKPALKQSIKVTEADDSDDVKDQQSVIVAPGDKTPKTGKIAVFDAEEPKDELPVPVTPKILPPPPPVTSTVSPPPPYVPGPPPPPRSVPMSPFKPSSPPPIPGQPLSPRQPLAPPVSSAQTTTPFPVAKPKPGIETPGMGVPPPGPRNPLSPPTLGSQPQTRSPQLPATDSLPAAPATSSPKTPRLRWNPLRSRWFKIAIIGGVLALIASLLAVPVTRYAILNTGGVRVSASLQVQDDATLQPLKNIDVILAGQEAKTDDEGMVRFAGLKLGKQELQVKKPGFDGLKKNVTLGWGSNPLGSVTIKPVGAQYPIVVKEWLTGQPIKKAEVTVGDASAFTDDEGVAALTLDQAVEGQLDVTIKRAGYRDETLSFDSRDRAERSVELVTSKQHYFVSNRSGKYDVYKIDIDGKNEELVIAGTGLETDDIRLVPRTDKPIAAMVSTRDNVRNEDGYLMSGLFLVDFDTNSLQKISQSERIEIITWSEDIIVYAKIADGASNTNPNRHKLISYDTSSGETKELASSNYFNDIMVMAGYVYYAPSNAFQENPNAQLFRVKPDGSEQMSVINKEVWNMFRLSYDTVDVLQQKDWYRFTINDTTAKKVDGAPANPKGRQYIDSPDGKRALWVDERDGKGVLLAYTIESKEDKVLQSTVGLSYPVRWLGDSYIVYRVSDTSGTADYVISADGGEPVKIRDVVGSAASGRWYYY